MTMLNPTTRRVALATGAILAATVAGLNVSHAFEAERTLYSPICLAILAAALGAAVAVPVAVSAYVAKRKVAAALLLFGALAGEVWSLTLTAERFLKAIEDRQRIARSENQPRDVAAQRLAREQADLTNAKAETARARNSGGCGKVCKDWEKAALQARERVKAAESELAAIPAAKSVNLLADRFGLSETASEIVPALMGSIALSVMAFGFLALGAHNAGVNRGDWHGTPKPLPAPRPQSGTRADQVRHYVQAYRVQHGRDPSFSEVRDCLGLPAATASKYRLRALA